MSKMNLNGIITVALLVMTSMTLQAGDHEFLKKRVSLTLERSNVEDVVRLLARQNSFNVAIAGDVAGEVSMVLNDVPLNEALDAILLPNNLAWYMRENLMVVKPAGTLTADERVTRLITIRNVSAEEARLAATPLLSAAGKLDVLTESETDSRDRAVPNRIVVSDRGDVVERVSGLIAELDQPQPQLNISVKLVETTLTNDNKLGVTWPESFAANFGGESSSDEDVSPALLTKSFNNGQWIWGSFTTANVQTALDLMLRSGNSRLLSDPNLTTLANKPAEIAITTTIPIQTLNRFTEGSVIQDIVSFQDLDVGITLRVTGRVADGEYVILDVNPVVEEITGQTGPASNQRPVTSKRSLNTSVRVKQGETLVIGGLLKDTKLENIQKLWLLGDIPILGRLFQHRTTKTEKTDLTVFITPKVISD
jgi:type IV pilus assembly protein PilQ